MSDQTAFAIVRVRDPLVAWLAYRGEMVSAIQIGERFLSSWTAGYLSRYARGDRGVRLRNEQQLEQQRVKDHPEAVPRLRGFFAFSDEPSAIRAKASWGSSFQDAEVVELSLRPEGRVSRHDSAWITAHLSLESEGEATWMGDYLAGTPMSGEPLWELVIDGRALILGKQVRETAYGTVKRKWPGSLPILELARLAVEVDSDLGLIAAHLTGVPPDRTVAYYMNTVDANDPEFVRRIRDHAGPVNHADLEGLEEAVIPDLRPRFFTLT
jgi:hypothetical protein